MIRLCTVGTSNICDEFLAAADMSGEFSLEAVYSRSYETGKSFAEKHNCKRVFTDLKEMAEDSELEAVYIASPNVFHYEQSRLFLENGKHVICEKPITTSLKEYDELKAIADKKGLIYMEAIMSRYNKAHSALEKALSQIGNVRMVRLDFNQRSSRLDRFFGGEHINIFDMSLKAGSFMDMGVYCVYAAVDLFGKPKNITANSYFFQNGADFGGYAVFDYGGFSALLSYGKAGQSAIGSEIIGDMGTVVIPSVSQFSGITLIKDGKTILVTPSLSKIEVMVGEAQAFADYILRYEQYRDEYSKASSLCRDVSAVMDEIKLKAGLNYPD